MNANEVRLSNLVYSKEIDLNEGREKDFVRKVDMQILFELLHGNTLKRYNPIPLTEEWLLKFGFEINLPASSREFILDESTKMVNHYENGWLFIRNNWDSGIFVNYVHQLQNLYFALTEQELTLNE